MLLHLCCSFTSSQREMSTASEPSVHSYLCQRRGVLSWMFSLMVCSDGGLKPQLMLQSHPIMFFSQKFIFRHCLLTLYVFPNPYAVVQIDGWYCLELTVCVTLNWFYLEKNYKEILQNKFFDINKNKTTHIAWNVKRVSNNDKRWFFFGGGGGGGLINPHMQPVLSKVASCVASCRCPQDCRNYNLGSERACHVPHAPLKPAYTCSLEMLHADFQHPLTCGLDFILYHIVHCSDFSQYF